MAITAQQYGDFDRAYKFLNDALFGGKLPDCFITINSQANSEGYFAHNAFINSADSTKTDEISLNYRSFMVKSTEYVLSTLVHEMCHQWQFHFGKPPRRCYHNKEWADKMESVGLMPSSTGAPGGKRTGQAMSDYIIDGGRFQREARSLIAGGFKIRWASITAIARQLGEIKQQVSATDRDSDEIPEEIAEEALELALESPKPKDSSKTKYSCPDCGQNAWAKPTASLKCGACDVVMESNENMR